MEPRDSFWRQPTVALGLLISALVLASLWAVSQGAVEISWTDVWGHADPNEAQDTQWVLFELRLPRVLFALGVGAALAMAGALTQGLFRNPLADPGLLGVSSGAACAAALVLVLLGAMGVTLPEHSRLWALPVAAFCGALAVCWLLDWTARVLLPGSIAGLLLVGIALNAVAGAVLGVAMYVANDEQLRALTFWSMGSLAAGQWTQVTVLAATALLAGVLAWQQLPALNALSLGVKTAEHVGIDVDALRRFVVLLVAVLTATAIAWTGLIGFVSLVAPHLIRLWVGADHRRVLPLSALMGGLLLLVADTLARTVAVPAEVPIGLFTALIGGPFFLMLLAQSRRRIVGD